MFAVNPRRCHCDVKALSACVTFMLIVCLVYDHLIKFNGTHSNPCGKGGEEGMMKKDSKDYKRKFLTILVSYIVLCVRTFCFVYP